MLAAIMVFSAMAVNVSAATTSTVGGITVTTGDDGSKSYLFNMATGTDTTGMPTNKAQLLGIGDWQFTSGGNTYDLGTLSLSTLLGKEYIDYNFKTQTGIANGTTAKVSGNYIRVVTNEIAGANGVPHKVDMFVYTTTISGTAYYYMEIYIDGLPVAYNRQLTTKYTSMMRFRDYMQPIQGLTTADTTGSIPANGWVIQYVGNEGSGTIDVDKVQRSTLTTEFFVQPLAATAAKLNSAVRDDDIIPGVKSDIDEKLVAELTKTTLGDRTITLSGSYSTVADLYDDYDAVKGTDSTNVKALLKTDGTEADGTASLGDVIL